MYSFLNLLNNASFERSFLPSLWIFLIISSLESSIKGIGFFSKSLTICQPNLVLNGFEKSPILSNLNAFFSNSETIFPTPKAGSAPPLTAVDLSSEKRSAKSSNNSPAIKFS